MSLIAAPFTSDDEPRDTDEVAAGEDDASGSRSDDDEDADQAEPTTTTERRRTTTTRPRPTTTTVDPAVVRAQLQAEFDNGVATACSVAAAAPLSSSDASIAAAAGSSYEPSWGQIAGRQQYVDFVMGCALPQRAARFESECQSEGPVELMNRDPDQFEGQCFNLVFAIVQFDQGTGRCAFRAYFDNVQREYNFEYLGENALVSFTDPCPELDTVGSDDVLRLRVVSQGGLSYDTTIGGSATAAAFQAIGGLEVLQDN